MDYVQFIFIASIILYNVASKASDVKYMFSELKEIGPLITFYLIGCVTNNSQIFTIRAHPFELQSLVLCI